MHAGATIELLSFRLRALRLQLLPFFLPYSFVTGVNVPSRLLRHRAKFSFFLFPFSFFLFLPSSLSAQPRFEASVSQQQINTQETFTLAFTLFDAEGTGFRAPDLSGFEVLSGPATRINASLVNGRASSETSYVYTLQPRGKGVFTIGSASIRAGNQTLKTAPLRIEVQEGRAAARDEAFVEARLALSQAWVGQQVVLDYIIHLRDPSWSVSVAGESGYEGFTTLPWGDAVEGSARIKGVEYRTLTERISLYPQKSGLLSVGPLDLDVMEWKRDEFSPFGHSTPRVRISSRPVSLEVRPLPPDAPPAFSGGVGRFVIEADLSRRQGTTDDAFALRLSIAGNGDMKQVEAPALTLPAGLQSYPPKMVEESTPKSYQLLNAQKTFEYLITAGEPGRYEIRAEFAYFDTDSVRYVTQTAGPFYIEVTQGRGAGVSLSPAKDAEAPEGPKTQKYLLGAIFASSLSLAAFLLWRLYLRRQAAPAIAQAAPSRDARRQLSLAAKYLHTSETEAFYQELSQSLYLFLGERFDIPPSEWTKAHIEQALQAHQVESGIAEKIISILHTAETALYAGMDRSAQAPEVYRAAVEVMDTLDKKVRE